MKKFALSMTALAVVSVANAAFAVTYTVDSVGLLDPNPSNLTITEVGNVSLAQARQITGAAHTAGVGGTVDFQQKYQGGTFPDSPSNNNGVDFGIGASNPLNITASNDGGVPSPTVPNSGAVATGSTILSFYRLESAGGINNFDSNINQGNNIISGGYKGRNPGTGTNYDGSARDGTAVNGPVDFTTGVPKVDVSTTSGNASGAYVGITNQGTPATIVFDRSLSFFGITALPRGATRDTNLTLTLSDGNTVVVGATTVVGSAAVFFGYQISTDQYLAGVGITRATLTNPNGAGVNRYDDLAFSTGAPVAFPEPASLAGLALGGVSLLRRRRA